MHYLKTIAKIKSILAKLNRVVLFLKKIKVSEKNQISFQTDFKFLQNRNFKVKIKFII